MFWVFLFSFNVSIYKYMELKLKLSLGLGSFIASRINTQLQTLLFDFRLLFLNIAFESFIFCLSFPFLRLTLNVYFLRFIYKNIYVYKYIYA